MYQFGTILMFQTFYEEGLIINILAIVNLLQNCLQELPLKIYFHLPRVQ